MSTCARGGASGSRGGCRRGGTRAGHGTRPGRRGDAATAGATRRPRVSSDTGNGETVRAAARAPEHQHGPTGLALRGAFDQSQDIRSARRPGPRRTSRDAARRRPRAPAGGALQLVEEPLLRVRLAPVFDAQSQARLRLHSRISSDIGRLIREEARGPAPHRHAAQLPARQDRAFIASVKIIR